eukprot:IDg3091t1
MICTCVLDKKSKQVLPLGYFRIIAVQFALHFTTDEGYHSSFTTTPAAPAFRLFKFEPNPTAQTEFRDLATVTADASLSTGT